MDDYKKAIRLRAKADIYSTCAQQARDFLGGGHNEFDDEDYQREFDKQTENIANRLDSISQKYHDEYNNLGIDITVVENYW